MLEPTGWAELANVSRSKGVNLVVPCSDKVLVDGMSSYFSQQGFRVFGPSKEAAELEGSKKFSKAFMIRHGIPTASYESFVNVDEAIAYVDTCVEPVVIKASGLAGGKGVILPETKAEARDAVHLMMVDKTFGDAGKEILVEKRLFGHEISMTLVTDGYTIQVFPAGQDAQRILDGNQGANTGGMGVYAPTPLVGPELLQQINADMLLPTVEGMRKEGELSRDALRLPKLKMLIGFR